MASLLQRLSWVMRQLDARPAGALSMKQLRLWLGQAGILLLPDVKSHHEVEVPQCQDPETGLPLVRTTVVLEVRLLDAASSEALTSRWIGQAVASPARSAEEAIASALEDFLRKTFLDFEPSLVSHHSPQAPPEHAFATSLPHPRPENDDIDLTQTSPALQTPDDQTHQNRPQAPPSLPTHPPMDDTPTPAWKAANALWRALVSEVVTTEVMDRYEEVLEGQHGVSSWREVSAQEIRAVCHGLRKRSAMPSDRRKIGEREEFILSHLPSIPPGSSLTRVEHELERLVRSVESRQKWEKFLSLYLQKMGVKGLDQISGRALIALCRKLRRLSPEERKAFVQHALDQAQGPEDHAA